jgi:hypothetical protein
MESLTTVVLVISSFSVSAYFMYSGITGVKKTISNLTNGDK